MRPTTPAGSTPTPPSCCGRPTPRRSPRSSRTSARTARCTWSSHQHRILSLKAWKYPLVGDKNVTMIERVIIDVDARKVIRLKMPPDQHRSTLVRRRRLRRRHGWDDVQWSADGTHLAFVSTSRDHKQEWLRVADAATGDVRDVMSETVAEVLRKRQRQDQLALSAGIERDSLVQRARQLGQSLPLRPDHRQAEEPDHARRRQRHAGAPRRREERARSTSSAWARSQAAILISSTSISVNFDGTGLKLLTPENADHRIMALSPRRPLLRRHVLDADAAAGDRGARRRRQAGDGRGASRTSRSCWPLGWEPPTPITVKARDGKTDLYGFMFKPTHFDRVEEISDHQLRLSRAADRLLRQPRVSRPRMATCSRSRSLASSWCASTAWERRAARRAFTRPTTATLATTPSPTRSPA